MLIYYYLYVSGKWWETQNVLVVNIQQQVIHLHFCVGLNDDNNRGSNNNGEIREDRFGAIKTLIGGGAINSTKAEEERVLWIKERIKLRGSNQGLSTKSESPIIIIIIIV